MAVGKIAEGKKTSLAVVFAEGTILSLPSHPVAPCAQVPDLEPNEQILPEASG